MLLDVKEERGQKLILIYCHFYIYPGYFVGMLLIFPFSLGYFIVDFHVVIRLLTTWELSALGLTKLVMQYYPCSMSVHL